MFVSAALHAFADKEPDMKHVFTCTVGMKPSAAKCYVVWATLSRRVNSLLIFLIYE